MNTELYIVIALIFTYVVPMILHFRQERVLLHHELLGEYKKVPFLYSWTSAVFGFWVPLFRGDLKWFFIFLIVGIFTFNLGAVVLAFFYNKIYIKNLIEKGYIPADEKSKEFLLSKGIIKNY